MVLPATVNAEACSSELPAATNAAEDLVNESAKSAVDIA